MIATERCLVRQCRTFFTKFKHDAAALVLDQDFSLTAACRAISAGETALRRWAEQLQFESGGSTPKGTVISVGIVANLVAHKDVHIFLQCNS